MKTKGVKIIASLLVFMLTFTYISIVQEAFATATNSLNEMAVNNIVSDVNEVANTISEEQASNTNVSRTGNQNADFDVYFEKSGANQYNATKQIGEQTALYAKVIVGEGYLKSSQITFDNPNFKIVSVEKNDYVSSCTENGIVLSKIPSDTVVEIKMNIEPLTGENVAEDSMAKANSAVFNSVYVDKNGKDKTVTGTATVGLVWDTQKNVEFDLDIENVIPYTSTNNKKYVLLQILAKAKLTNNTLPLAGEKLEINLPIIDNNKVEEVVVSAKTMKQITGEDGVNFSSDNYSYNKESNLLKIEASNVKDSNGKISWKKDAQDEYIVTAVYSADNINLEASNYTAKCTGTASLITANKIETSKVLEKTLTISKEKTKSIVDYEIKANTAKVSKGQIYANYNRNEKQETEYEETIIANITYANMVEKIAINQKPDSFSNSEISGSTTYEGINYTYFKELSIAKGNFEKILGLDGKVNIYNGTTLLATVNSDMKVNQANNYVVDLSTYNTNDIKIETTKPVKEGKLVFNVRKAIKGDVGYSISQMKEFTDLQMNLSANTSYKNITNAEEVAKTGTVQFTEPETKAEFVIDNPTLSTVVENKNVKLTAVLRTDSLDCRLYKDPTIRVTFPSYMEKINVKEIRLYFETEGTKLSSNGGNWITNENGTKTLEIALDGTQTEYTLGAISKGINLTITADITLNKLTASKQDKIIMTYTNNYIENEEKTLGAPVDVVAPTGVVTISSVSDYAEGAEEVTVISEESSAARIATMADPRTATFNMTVLNNYNNTIDNLVVLGRTLFAGNKEVETGSDLNSNINIPLVGEITTSGIDSNKVKVYYSENGTATKDLTLESNGWTLQPTDFKKVKSYLIVVENYTMQTAEALGFSYRVAVPANLEYNQFAVANYIAYFNNNLATGTIQDKEVSTIFGLSTGTGPVLDVNVTSDTAEDKELVKGDEVNLTLTIKNVGTETANNVVAKIVDINCFMLVNDSSTIEIGNIPAGGTITKQIGLVTTNTLEDREVAETKFQITSDNISKTLEDIVVKHTILKTYFTTSTTIISKADVIQEEDEFQYYVGFVANGSYNEETEELDKSEKDVKLELDIPKDIEYKNVEVKTTKLGVESDITNTVTSSYNPITRRLTVNFPEVDTQLEKQVYITVKVNKLETNVYDKVINVEATLSGRDARAQRVSFSNVRIGKPGFKITQTSSIPASADILPGEDFIYSFEIENLSRLALDDVQITDILPKELVFSRMEVTAEGGTKTNKFTKDESGNPITTIDFDSREKVKVDVLVSAKALDEEKEITNYLKLKYSNMEEVESNRITHTIKAIERNPNNPSDDEGDKPFSDLTKRIMGVVWLDKNSNGIKDADEEKVKNVDVLLFNNTTGKVVTNELGEMLVSTTNSDGLYSFINVPQGKYTVIFLYDTANYSATTYQKDGVATDSNSDAIDKEIVIDGENRLAGITEEIVVQNTNVYNIDLGLVENPKFDLRLDKTVSKITVQDSEKTETTDYNRTKLAKKDLVGSKVNDTTIVVEYKIAVTNEGGVAGYVKKIADYIPKEMKFTTDLNPDWYISQDREILNSSLADTLLKPGETKEVTLVLTKKMSSESLGLMSNTAEIYESYNDLGLKDIDSKVANKATEEDDISSADILITVKTGEAIMFVALSLGIIAVIGISAIIIKKKVLR
ncbi:MAG: hypothetical protein J6M60_02640 [Clostridia bacterium]|nr:hypothetical protein [Clostridia bacterium]